MEQGPAAFGALALRLSLGVMYLAHAGLKIFVFSLPGTAAFFAAHGFPGWSAYPVAAAEVVAGLLLVLGLHVRAVALGMLPVLLGAALVHLPNGWVFSNPNGGWEYPVFLAVASVVQAPIGEGAWAPGGVRPRPDLDTVRSSRDVRRERG